MVPLFHLLFICRWSTNVLISAIQVESRPLHFYVLQATKILLLQNQSYLTYHVLPSPPPNHASPSIFLVAGCHSSLFQVCNIILVVMLHYFKLLLISLLFLWFLGSSLCYFPHGPLNSIVTIFLIAPLIHTPPFKQEWSF